MMTVQKTAVVLNSPHDWEVWFNIIRNCAIMADIWKFIDPLKPKNKLPKPTKATLPLSIDVNPNKMLIGNLTIEECEELKMR